MNYMGIDHHKQYSHMSEHYRKNLIHFHLMGIPFTITMGFLFTIVLGIQLTISRV